MLFRALLIALCVPALLTAAPDLPKGDKRARNDALFTNGVVRSIEIEMPPENVQALKKDARKYVSCTVKDGAITYTNVGVRLKGVGSFRPIDQKPSFSFKFNQFVPKQDFYGLTKMALNNSVQDPSYINEALCTQLFRDIGVPAARTTHAWVRLNGRELGFYVLAEGINKPFLRRHFKTDEGNLYEGYTQDIDEVLDQDNGEDITQSDLRELAKAAREPNSNERWERLNKLLDVDKFISMMAGEILTIHWDGYWINKNNYRIYNDLGRMVMFPHGMDNMFQQPAWSWRPSMSGLLTRAVLLTSEGNRRYRERISTILTNQFRVPVLTNRLNEIAARIRPGMADRNPAGLNEWEDHVAGLRDRILARLANVSEQLAALKQPLTKFDSKGVASLDGWKSHIDAGQPQCTQAGEILKIKQSGSGAGIASWRARAVLDPGNYRFEGKVKAMEVIPTNRSDVGAMLRISGSKVVPQIRAAADWRVVPYDFEVQFPSDQVELVCELACLVGEAWFDASSMRLIRLP